MTKTPNFLLPSWHTHDATRTKEFDRVAETAKAGKNLSPKDLATLDLMHRAAVDYLRTADKVRELSVSLRLAGDLLATKGLKADTRRKNALQALGLLAPSGKPTKYPPSPLLEQLWVALTEGDQDAVIVPRPWIGNAVVDPKTKMWVWREPFLEEASAQLMGLPMKELDALSAITVIFDTQSELGTWRELRRRLEKWEDAAPDDSIREAVPDFPLLNKSGVKTRTMAARMKALEPYGLGSPESETPKKQTPK